MKKKISKILSYRLFFEKLKDLAVLLVILDRLGTALSKLMRLVLGQ